ncbi:hypothetical protein ACEQ8H_007593 [Pleosporales sp. CAS-2024a]
MPRYELHKFQGKEEHLIFVKNVPAYMVDKAIVHLYNQYDPVRFKNVYPDSDITTIVVGFRTHDTAVQAQQETDGLRLETVVLRVELYTKQRSIRYLQDQRNKAKAPSDANEDAEEEEEYQEPAREEEERHVLPLGHDAATSAPGRKTWARIIAGKQTTTYGMMPLPPPAKDIVSRPATPIHDQTAKSTPTGQVAVPYMAHSNKADDSATVDSDTASNITSESSKGLSGDGAGYEGDVEDNKKIRKQRIAIESTLSIRESLFSTSESIDSSKLISERHARDCEFCQMRERSRG